MISPRTGPVDYTYGLGEVIRGYRLYVGLSRNAMAIQIGISFRGYDRIEDGDRPCPPEFIDSIRDVVQRFERAVEEMQLNGPDNPRVELGIDQEWDRAVACRAAVGCARITPVRQE